MAKIKVCLDAGHNGKYNRSPAVREYYESDMNWKLHLLLKSALEAYGIEVVTTRANQNMTLGTINRGAASKGCDLFLSIHANAVGGGVNEAVDYPLVIVQLDRKGEELGKTIGKVIRDTMGTAQPFDLWTKANSSGQEAYGVLRGAASVGTMGMILEHSFYTQTRACRWLMEDSNLTKLAQAEAAVIAEYFGVKKEEKPSGSIEPGDVVSLTADAQYYTGKAVPAWVKAKLWIVKKVEGDRAVIDKAADGSNAINSPVHIKYLALEEKAAPPATPVTPTVPAEPEKSWEPVVGDVVNFTGSTHYTSPDAVAGIKCASGTAKITKIDKGEKHPYHLVRTGKTGPWGWVNAGTFTKA